MAEATLLDALEEDTRNQCAVIIREAEETAERIGKEAVEAAQAAFDTRMLEARSSLARRRAAAINAARTRMGGLTLGVRHHLMDEVFARSLKRFKELPKDEYAKLLNSLYAETKADWLRAGITEKPIVLISESDAGLIKDQADFRFDASVSLGVVFVSFDARLRFENTIQSRMAKARTELIPVINKVLFG